MATPRRRYSASDFPPEIWAKIQAVPKEALLNLSSLPPDDPIYQNDYLIFFPASPSIGGTPASPLPPPPAAPER